MIFRSTGYRCYMVHLCLWLMVGAFGFPSTSLAQTDIGEAYFAEPTSGRRVTSYDVDLPTGREERRLFAIPEECAVIEGMLQDGLSLAGGIVDRRLWRKVGEDCWFHTFLRRHPLQEIVDHVTGYDFMNAHLDDLPIDTRCGNGNRAMESTCQGATTDEHGLLQYFPIGKAPERTDETARSDCMLQDGVFYGRLSIQDSDVQCNADNARPSLRLIAVDYADINGDRVLDAVLRFMPIGPGAARTPLILPLTRTAPSRKFSVPQQVTGKGSIAEQFRPPSHRPYLRRSTPLQELNSPAD